MTLPLKLEHRISSNPTIIICWSVFGDLVLWRAHVRELNKGEKNALF